MCKAEGAVLSKLNVQKLDFHLFLLSSEYLAWYRTMQEMLRLDLWTLGGDKLGEASREKSTSPAGMRRFSTLRRSEVPSVAVYHILTFMLGKIRPCLWFLPSQLSWEQNYRCLDGVNNN